MLVPYVITYELEPPSWLGARKNQSAPSATSVARPFTIVRVRPADGRGPPAVTVFRLRTGDHIEAVGRRGRSLRRSRCAADAAGRVDAGVPGAAGHELDADRAGRRRGDRERHRIDIGRIRAVRVVADAADGVAADHIRSLTERSVRDRVRSGERVPGHGDADGNRRDQGPDELAITETQRRSVQSPPPQSPAGTWLRS